MKLSRKFSDFLRLEEAEGNLPKLAGMGTAVASSFAVIMLAPALAFAGPCIHGDYHSDIPAHTDDSISCFGNPPFCTVSHSNTPHSDSYVGCY